jgi:peroxiredoxin
MHSKAPLFEAFDATGQKVVLQNLLQKGPVVVCFYRGQWCPYCNRHMSNLQDSVTFITALGASLLAITPEKNSEINKTISKTGASFSIIYDEGHKIMDAYKVSFKVDAWKNLLHFAEGVNINKASGNNDNVLPVPATYIISTDGIIIGRQFDTDYTQRMPVKTILEVLKAITVSKK